MPPATAYMFTRYRQGYGVLRQGFNGRILQYAKQRTSCKNVHQRLASTTAEGGIKEQASKAVVSTSTLGASGGSRMVNFLYGTTLLLGTGVLFVYVTDTRASVHRYVVVPTLRALYPDPERAHEVGNYLLKALWTLGLHPRERRASDDSGDLKVEIFGTTLKNPIGTSAGIDKHADIPDPLLALGPSIVEIGGVTPKPQPGNEKPRVFRLTSQQAMINRYGLNSEGADIVAARLKQRVREYAYRQSLGFDEVAERQVLDGKTGVPPGSLMSGRLLAVNIAKNKSTPEGDIQAVADDYVYCVKRLAPYADILVVNVSSPNTPGLRSLQQGDSLRKLLTAVVGAAHATDRRTKPAVMVKVSPDEDSDEQVSSIAQAVWDSGVDGVIVGNTTNRRPEALPRLRNLSPFEEQSLLEQGGFSGPHLFEQTLTLVKKYNKMLAGNSSRSKDAPSQFTTLPSSSYLSRSSPDNDSNDKAESSVGAVRASVHSGVVLLKDISDTPASEKTPLLNPPSRRFYDTSPKEQSDLESSRDKSSRVSANTTPARSKQTTSSANPPKPDNGNEQQKVIFATGGITNGPQALEILNAGASIAMVYTALVYGGAGTISRIKDEMRANMARNQKPR